MRVSTDDRTLPTASEAVSGFTLLGVCLLLMVPITISLRLAIDGRKMARENSGTIGEQIESGLKDSKLALASSERELQQKLESMDAQVEQRLGRITELERLVNRVVDLRDTDLIRLRQEIAKAGSDKADAAAIDALRKSVDAQAASSKASAARFDALAKKLDAQIAAIKADTAQLDALAKRIDAAQAAIVDLGGRHTRELADARKLVDAELRKLRNARGALERQVSRVRKDLTALRKKSADTDTSQDRQRTAAFNALNSEIVQLRKALETERAARKAAEKQAAAAQASLADLTKRVAALEAAGKGDKAGGEKGGEK